jgi:hypothetical protein
MRWLFLLLLCANVAIFVWGYQKEMDGRGSEVVVPPGIGNLQLLSEINGGGTDAAAEEADQGVPSPEILPVENQPEPEAPVVAEIGQDGMGVREQDASGDVLPSGGQTEDKTGEGVAEVGLVCGSLGPFERGSLARSVVAELTRQGIDASLQQEMIQKPIGFWVLIPPLASQQEAIRVVEDLSSQGVRDIRRFVKGTQKNGISLGVFSSRENAEKRRREILTKGKRTEIQPRHIKVSVYRVEYRANSAGLQQTIEGLKRKHPEIEDQKSACPHVVSLISIP